MSHIDYLLRLSVNYQIIHESEELIEKIFVSQVYLTRRVKYIMIFIYNTYGSQMSVRTDYKKEIYGLHQSSGGGVKLEDVNSLGAILRKLRKETRLRIYHLKAKQIKHDDKYSCDLYAIELDIGENSEQIEQDKIGPQRIILYNMYINMVTNRLLTLIHYTYIKLFLKEVGIITSDINIMWEEYDEIL